MKSYKPVLGRGRDGPTIRWSSLEVPFTRDIFRSVPIADLHPDARLQVDPKGSFSAISLLEE